MSQTDSILNHLKSGQSITPLAALELFRCMRLAPRIRELREAGYRIQTTIIRQNGKRYAGYMMDRA